MFKVTKKIADKIMSFDSKTRGVVFITDATYVRTHYSEAKLDLVKSRLKSLGYPIDYDKIMNTEWYPSGLRVLSLLVITEVLKLSNHDLILMGDEAPKFSFFIRFVAKFINTLDLVVKKAGTVWARQVTRGSLELKQTGKSEITVRFNDFNIHDIYLIYLQGYFRRFVQFIVPNATVKCKLIKKYSKDRNYAEYKVYW